MALKAMRVSDVTGDRGKNVTGWQVRARFDASNAGATKVIAQLEKLGITFDIFEDVANEKVPTNRPSSEVREWGRANGFNVSERGRFSKALVSAFDAASKGL